MYIDTNSGKEGLSKDSVEDISHREGSGTIDTDSLQKDHELQNTLNKLPNAFNISFPGQDQYLKDIYHWATSSSQESICTVQPDTAQDVARILKWIEKARLPNGSPMPFGVKSGGHTGNPGFSSSPGILISMKRFNQVVYHPESQTAVIGAGQIWDDVYEELARHNVAVLGARVTHIGVAGFILGGGYSWQTNQHGLAIDTVTAFELVKTDGTIVDITEASDPDLFFALRGGGNNFGIITSFTIKTFPQGLVWGGPLLLLGKGPDIEEKIKKLFYAVQKFIDGVTDPKAAILVSLGTMEADGPAMLLNFIAFYDGPSPPAGIFDVFQELAPEETSELWKTRTFLDFVQNAMYYEGSLDRRGAFHTVGLSRYTSELLEAVWEQNERWGSKIPPATTRNLLTYSVEPFLPNILSHGSPSAYPPDRSIAFSPFPIYLSWKDPKYDAELQEIMKKVTQEVQDAADKYGIMTGPRYPNYAISGTPLEEMYGKNVEKLKEVKAKVDPSNLMGHAGGFKF
ncbi:hypothetical protein CPB84DRAFT_1803858 [Gymnopilus junonius]|uniref:FAD-binding PCMH-type domain-containing protein n=1 Tax=Gymnopilus junonius TaxID=109634 RepID=A0A9P5N9C9_GYMJU|nr:hypothetical protein CPB84DRAFT_1803858 [Gymnopilus junonius]